MLRIAVIGAGGNARGHGKRLRAIPDVQVAALADPSEASVDAFLSTVWPDGADADARPKTYADHRAMLEAEKLDAVLISSPHTLHYQQIVDSLAAGLHVLSEKPLVCSFDENLEVIEKAGAAGRHVVVSYQRRFSPLYRSMRRRIHSQEFGNVYTVAQYLSQGWLWGQRGKWRSDPKLSGGGQLHDSGSHIVDMLMWLLDEDIETVAALIDNRGLAVDVDSMITYRTVGGALGSVSIAGSGPKGLFWEDLTVMSDTGHAILYRNGTLQMNDGHGTKLEPAQHIDEQCPNQDAHFVDVVLGRAQNESPPQDFLRVIAFTEACWESARQGGAPVKVRSVGAPQKR